MSQPNYISALDLHQNPEIKNLKKETQDYFDECIEKLGFVPNVLLAYAFDETKLDQFMGFYNNLMLDDSGLSKLEREMIAVVVSSYNRCYYCMVAHGAAVRHISKDPMLGEVLCMNYKVAKLSSRHRIMLDFAWKMSESPMLIEDADRQNLRDNGFDDKDIWDISAVASFYNMTNRMASAINLMPNPGYHKKARG
jgi:uncharacterized peroxidase-related enzyme|tara:strand:- start:451 stop:1035 length:585 start_codon:yes stop_codon:yes gene_type:complete